MQTIKEQRKTFQSDLLRKELETELSKEVKKLFSDAELLKVEEKNKL